MPDAAPVPAKPMKCPDPILLANSEAPTYYIYRMLDRLCSLWFLLYYNTNLDNFALTILTGIKCILREAKKYPPTESRLLFHDD